MWDLLAEFDLRRRADTDTYLEGVELAHDGAVRVEVRQVSNHRLVAHVDGQERHTVQLTASQAGLNSFCACDVGRHGEICTHAVAVAHSVWMRSVTGLAP